MTVEMMHQTGKFKLALIEEPQMQVLELPYVNSTLGRSFCFQWARLTTEQQETNKQENSGSWEAP